MRQPSRRKRPTLSSMRASRIAKFCDSKNIKYIKRKSVSSNSIYMTIENHIFRFSDHAPRKPRFDVSMNILSNSDCEILENAISDYLKKLPQNLS